ncbi:helix-turn-helix domain-containing protein [Rhizobium sp. WSM1274]|uniref:Crp/Fnr family transcriptional regulator n=1 Tax=Rhizobium TaxID=379 RepID=UPI001C95A64F|nr:helix-turn-helix domain-containing protein [Rhizobium leguminosarum]MBY5405109.1 helix-turn-helix domain-containing protein [Rhizobium leguminosarum]UWM80235.1 helix-turn-helix domain-containing protein [Rhizobium leguminosarum bv. viciae]UWU26997.1 helix-turn-helix domain-containing protein [Rhizobium leguminosarum bv. viciae]
MLMQNRQGFQQIEATTSNARGGPSLGSVFNMSPLESVSAGKAICWEGDAAKHLFQVVEGVVRLQRIIGEGRRVITAFHFGGDVVGAFLQNDFLFTAEAVTDCKIRRVARKRFLDEVGRCDLLRPEYISLLCNETVAAHDQMVLLSKKNAEERLCSFIARLVFRHTAGVNKGLLRIPMNRQDIADYLGLTIETVSRTITKLASRNIVVPEGRHDLRIVNLRRLQELSGNPDDFSEKTCHSVSLH